MLQWWAWAYSEDEYQPYLPPPVPLKTLGVAREVRRRARAPSWAQMDACIRAARGWHRKLYIVLRCTGLRVQEAMALRWEDVDLETGTLYIPTGKTLSEKAGRWVPLAPALTEIISTWERDGEYLVPCGRRTTTKREERLARSRDAARAWKRAGVDDAYHQGRPHHAFRKGFVSGLNKLDADPEAVETLVGHDLSIRGLYLDPEYQPLREAVAKVPRLPADLRPTPDNVVPLRRTG